MHGDRRGLTVPARFLRFALLVVLLIGVAGGDCDVIDILSIPGYSGGSINLVIPLGLGGDAGIFNPVSGDDSTTTPDDGSTSPPIVPATDTTAATSGIPSAASSTPLSSF